MVVPVRVRPLAPEFEGVRLTFFLYKKQGVNHESSPDSDSNRERNGVKRH